MNGAFFDNRQIGQIGFVHVFEFLRGFIQIFGCVHNEGSEYDIEKIYLLVLFFGVTAGGYGMERKAEKINEYGVGKLPRNV